MANASRPQRTIARESGVRGISFLSGRDVAIRFRPALAGTGVVFARTDLPGSPTVPALVDHVVPRRRRTAIQRGEAVVEMVEHVMAALAGLQIDNCLVEIDGPEAPGCDGSSLAFVDALLSAGVTAQDATKTVLTIDAPVTVRDGAASLSAFPGDVPGLVLTYNLDYAKHPAIGRQSLFVEVGPESFRSEIAASRTFVLQAEADAMRQAGIGPRTTAADLLIFGPEGVVGNELRFPDECVRHKILDLIGDLALSGVDLSGHVVAHRSGHSLNAELVRTLLGKATAPPPPSARGARDIDGVLKTLPHRFPFLLVDRVLEVVPGSSAVAIKNVSYNEPFFPGHWPGRAIMPGVLIVEALAQAAGVLIADSVPTEGRDAVIASLQDVKLRRAVVPGDQLRLEVEAVRIKGRSADVKGVATVDGRVAAEARIRFVLVPSARPAGAH